MTSKTLIVDADAVTMVLGAEEHTREHSRRAIDEIAERIEAELARRGLDGYEVEREYLTTGRRSAEDMESVWETVLVGQVNEIRAAVLGA